MKNQVQIIGGGLAGSEAAWQAAEQGLTVHLYEMRPEVATGAHVSEYLAELVCSNSLGSKLPDRASGLLMAEARALGSMLLEIAEKVAVPAGGALAVDREGFAKRATKCLEDHPRIQIHRQEMKEIPEGLTILASGPLTSDALSESIETLTGREYLYFFDALAPIAEFDSINMNTAFFGSRYGRGELDRGDYINCPLDQEEYEAFVDALLSAERIPLRSFEKAIESGVRVGAHKFFEGCLPIEIIAERGKDALAFGPMRPVGLTDPRTGRRPYAVVQLRQDDYKATLFNLVGFQTNLTYSEQRRVLRMIPGLGSARFARYGQMHRNTFINSPTQLFRTLQHRVRPDLFFAGQITGVEGYLGNIATGLLAGLNAARLVHSKSLIEFPSTTMLGSLCEYITHADAERFQPMKANFGIVPALDDGKRRSKRQRAQAYTERALYDLNAYMARID
jgi:methylenetetrahydrofolate--tRNA-(uracil-5-)-methyltransferase